MKSHPIRFLGAALACALLLLAASRSETASPADDAMHVVQRWAKAFNEPNVDAIVSLYAPDALFFGTGSKTLVSKPEQIRTYFEGALLKTKLGGAQLLEHSVKVISNNVVIVTGMDRVSGTKDGKPFNLDGRVTFVIEKRGTNWQIVHFHRSAVPAP